MSHVKYLSNPAFHTTQRITANGVDFVVEPDAEVDVSVSVPLITMAIVNPGAAGSAFVPTAIDVTASLTWVTWIPRPALVCISWVTAANQLPQSAYVRRAASPRSMAKFSIRLSMTTS